MYFLSDRCAHGSLGVHVSQNTALHNLASIGRARHNLLHIHMYNLNVTGNPWGEMAEFGTETTTSRPGIGAVVGVGT